MTRKIKTIALVKTDPIDGSFLDVEIYGSLTHLQQEVLPAVKYAKIWNEIKANGFSETTIPSGENEVRVTVLIKEMKRGTRKKNKAKRPTG